MSCENATHLDLIHFALQRLPVLVGLPARENDDGEMPICQSGEMKSITSGGIVDVFEEECEEEAWLEIALPGIDPEEGSTMFEVDLCRRHFALLILRGEELTEKLGSHE